MNDKEKQIEEMAKDYYGYSIDLEEDCKFVAKEMYDKGHRKISEDTVVLSRKRYDKLRSLYDEVWDAYYDGENNAKVYYEGIKIPQVRKETTDKIVRFLEDYCDCDSVGLVEQLKEYLAKEQLNVEAKE